MFHIVKQDFIFVYYYSLIKKNQILHVNLIVNNLFTFMESLHSLFPAIRRHLKRAFNNLLKALFLKVLKTFLPVFGEQFKVGLRVGTSRAFSGASWPTWR